MRFPDFKNERQYLAQGYVLLVGCDEVGVAPLAGPVVAATCVLDPESIGSYRSKKKWYARVRDSKTINEQEREMLLKEILKHALCYGIGVVSEKEIDKLNIHHASLEAMRRAMADLENKLNQKTKKMFLLVDGRFTVPHLKIEQKAVIKGDTTVLSIAAASIIAKVHRDAIMKELDSKFPGYGFKKHKGYPTKQHHEAIKKLGITSIHRKSFIKNDSRVKID